jgi:hypothetical protein
MKYEFLKHVGAENFNTEDDKNMFRRMCEVLDITGAEVNFHLLPKKERFFLCPVACVSMKNNKLVIEENSCFKRKEINIRLTKNRMVQIIKKALKNYTRKKALASLELSATI